MITNEFRYGMSKLSSLGSYPFHLLMIILVYKLEMPPESLFLLIGFILTYVIGVPLRFFLFRKRPHPAKQDIFLQKYHISSFPSFHAARATFLGIFLAHIFNYEVDIIFLSCTLILLVSSARVVNRQHFTSDVLAGIVFGIALWSIAYSIVPI